MEKKNIIYNISQQLKKELGRVPTIEEISNATGIEENNIKFILERTKVTSSLNKIYENDNGSSDKELIDYIDDNNQNVEIASFKTILKKEMEELFRNVKLSEREIQILRERYKECPSSLQKIGDKYKITGERVRQIQASSIKKLRNSKKIKHFAIYMDNPKKAIEKIDYYQGKTCRKRKKDKKEIKNLYECFKQYSNSEIQLALEKLPASELKKIYEVYGNNLTNNYSYNDSAYAELNTIIIPHIKQILEAEETKEKEQKSIDKISNNKQKNSKPEEKENRRKKMKKVNESLLREEKEREIKEFIEIAKEKFISYNDYIDADFYKNIYSEAKKIEDIEDIDIENMIMKKLAYLSDSDDKKLLSEIIKDYKYRAGLIIERIGKEKCYDEELEKELIIKALESYQGDKMFSLHMVNSCKEMFEEKKGKQYIKKNS